jgi:hypothetical protein
MRALLCQAFIPSARSWFVALGIEDPVWDATTFTKNRDRLLKGDMAAQFLAAVLSQDEVKGLLSSGAFLGRRNAVGGVGEPEEFARRPALRKGGTGQESSAVIHGPRADGEP